MPTTPPIFDRVIVDYLTRGGARISWCMDEHFIEASPWTFQLQVSDTDVASGNWTNVGDPLTNVFMTTDPSQEYYGKEQSAFYRVVITTAIPNTYYSDPVSTTGALDFKNWGIANEIIRKETLRLQYLGVGIDGFFLKYMRSGTIQTNAVDQFTGDVIDSGSTASYGNRFTGGYYNAVPAVFGDIDPHQHYENRDLQSGSGMVDTQITKGIFLAMPFISMNDVWCNKTSDLRYWLHDVTILTHMRGVPLITAVGMRPIPPEHVIYEFPVPLFSTS